MQTKFLRHAALALALFGATAVAWTQNTTFVRAQNAGTSPQGQVPGPNATPPQAAALPSDTKPPVQPAPGAMPDSDSVPSTISEKNAADDKLIVLAYTFKHLTPEQRRVVYEELKDLPPPGPAPAAELGVELPLQVELLPVPKQVSARVPATNGYQYTISNNKVLLVWPATRGVVGEFAG